ncbi:hypothetical protein CYY_007803 [Polysphondylium violaceum]|uniref:SH3 domain-containing protein n=1 Tax=Polysphondylium violaceum TaxID=133409 RepID=A0A8J4PMY9_9MYCE|nr:hypothetical protein CYY_007803 [Polysphondylium violaceum]
MSFQFKDNFWGPSGFETVEKRINEGTESTRLFVYFMKERASIEENYSKSLQKLLKNTQQLTEFGTLRDAWFAMRGEVETQIRVHHELGNKLVNDIAAPFSKFKSEQKKVKKGFLEDAYKLNRERKDMEQKISKSKVKYDDYSRQAEQMAVQMESAKSTKAASEIGKIQQKLQKLQREASLFEKDYRDYVGKLSAYQPQWEEKVSSTYHALQCTEEERIDYIKVQLEKYVQAINSTVPDTESINRNLIGVVASIDRFEDISLFVREAKTGSERPDPPVFVPFGGKASSEYISNKSTYSLTSSASSSSLGNLPPQPSTPPPSRSSAPPTKQARALYDYVGSDATELDFYTGDSIKVLEEDDSGWWKGELDGRVGLFPSNYCQVE